MPTIQRIEKTATFDPSLQRFIARKIEYSPWSKWFAWYPVRLGDPFSSEKIAWLQVIERKHRFGYGYIYRIITPNKDK